MESTIEVAAVDDIKSWNSNILCFDMESFELEALEQRVEQALASRYDPFEDCAQFHCSGYFPVQ